MMLKRQGRLPRILSLPLAGGLLAVALLLAGCAGSQAFREGNALLAEGKVQQGLARMEESVRLEPGNMEYRIALASRRASAVNRLVLAADGARRDNRLSDAEKAYREVQAIEPENAMARQGMEAVTVARRHQALIAEAEEKLKKGSAAEVAAALEMLRPVLVENPKNRAALNLKARLEEARARLARPEARLAASYRQPISLEFREAPLRSVLEVVAKVSSLNFYYDKDIRPDLKVTVFAKNTTTEDALRLLLVTNQLEQKVLNENSVLIYPSTPQKLKEYQTLAVRSFYLTNADVKAISNSIKTIVKTKDIVIDERLGIIIVRDTPEAVRMAERIVALQDLGDSEVMLDVEVLEVKRSRLLELGVRWPTALTLTPLASSGSTITLDDLRHLGAKTVQASVGSVALNVNKEDQDSSILANPRIRVRNKDKAKVQIGDRVPVITTTSTSTGFVSESVNYVDVGLKLEVEPNIYLDDEVAIKMNLEVSSLVREIVSRGGTLAYQIGSRGATTTLRLKDGETQILAGLISDEDRSTANKLPVVGDLPVAGRLFGSQKDDNQRTEILLSITPHIVRTIGRPDMVDAEFESGTESSIGTPTLRLSTADEAAPAPATAAPSAAGTAPGTVQPAAVTAVPGVVPAVGAAATPSAAPAAAPATIGGPLGVSWQGPAQVKVGEQFSAVLRVNSQQALRGMPLMLGFDPQVFQVIGVQEGDFFKQGRAPTSFSQRIDPAQGKVFVALVRQGVNGGQDAGINGTGALVSVNLKAIKPASAARIQVLSASPEPMPGAALALPVEHSVRVVP
jgi:general secretion pathway protein D